MSISKAINLLKGEIVPKECVEFGLDKNDTAFHIIEEIFTRGNCANLAFALKELIPGSRVLRCGAISHYWLEYERIHYDIKGENDSLKALYDDGLTEEVFLESISNIELNNYSFAMRGPIA